MSSVAKKKSGGVKAAGSKVRTVKAGTVAGAGAGDG